MKQSLAERRIQLGVGVTRGLGAGSRPEIGRIAAEEALEEIMRALDGSNMVFITAGMGGGTGTGAAPVIARAAREAGILTVGVVTKPFHFEGTHRMRLAEAGIQELQKFVDTLIIIPNQNLFRVANERTTFADAFKMADDVLASGVRGVTDLMVMPGLINLDFADIRAVMSEMGKAMMGTGEAEGDRRAIDAAEAAISNPLLEDVSMKGARGVLINITGGLDMTLFEVDEAANRIREEVDPDANIIFGSTFDEKLDGTHAHLGGGDRHRSRPGARAAAGDQPGERPQRATTAPPRPLRAGAPGAGARRHAGAAARARARSAAGRGGRAGGRRQGRLRAAAPGRAVVPRAVRRPCRRRRRLRHAAAGRGRASGGAKPKSRMPSLFERVTKAGRLMKRDEPPAGPRVAPAAAAAAAARRASTRPTASPPHSREEDLLDIPAFLRRQAN